MKRFSLTKEPLDFAESVRAPGANWLAENPQAQRPYDFWSPCRNALADAFSNLCAYTAMYTPTGTVDHFESWNESRTHAYEWSNYRYAAGWFNSCKQALRAQQLIDPFEVGTDWFEISLPSLQLVASKTVPPDQVDRVDFMLRRLKLGHDERVLRQRRKWFEMYQCGKLTLEGLQEMAPLIADAVTRQTKEIQGCS